MRCKADTSDDFKCLDCDQNTSVMDEYYMVQFELWGSVTKGDGMLCIGCLETRLDRKLVAADFIDAPINQGSCPQSARLLDRLGA